MPQARRADRLPRGCHLRLKLLQLGTIIRYPLTSSVWLGAEAWDQECQGEHRRRGGAEHGPDHRRCGAAAEIGLRKARHFPTTTRTISEDEAISLMAAGVDFGMTQVVDGGHGAGQPQNRGGATGGALAAPACRLLAPRANMLRLSMNAEKPMAA